MSETQNRVEQSLQTFARLLESPAATRLHAALREIEETPADPLGLLKEAQRRVGDDLHALVANVRLREQLPAAKTASDGAIRASADHFEDTVARLKGLLFRLNEDGHGRNHAALSNSPERAFSNAYRKAMTALALVQIEIRKVLHPTKKASNSHCLKLFSRPEQAPPDPLIDEFIEAYEAAFGSRLRAGYFRPTSRGDFVEVDLESDLVMVEVKVGSAGGQTAQLLLRLDPSVNPKRKIVIALLPERRDRARELSSKGILVATTVWQAIAMIRELHANPAMRNRLSNPDLPRHPDDLRWLASHGIFPPAHRVGELDQFERARGPKPASIF